jgi:UDP-N-acetylglucosamine diphosphorylase / glucose-1-phosphate thymidylyltransferase / UDP-N-acetylgalactosamine diphosphorylase / glucosamine-1-phosphate N-acetyltransferase / galactosamine-1-phosphate N-acetyltransferase
MNKEVILSGNKNINDDLFPFTLIRSAPDIRIGILTIREKWNRFLGKPVQVADDDIHPGPEDVVIPANVVPDAELVDSLLKNNKLTSDRLAGAAAIRYPWEIFLLNDWAIREDFKLVTRDRFSNAITESVIVTNPREIFIEADAKLSHCIINASHGPVYVGKNAEIMEGALIRGPVAICEGAVVKMGTRIYGATTIGPHCVVGGEIKNSVIFGYSNKAHDGYLGDSVIGEWCNLGAGTSNSNVKNNASEVKAYIHRSKTLASTGLIKCGLLMGDYSRTAINTAFNTGTVVGVCANVVGETGTNKFIPSFTWGTSGRKYELQKAIEDIAKWKKMKGRELDEKERIRLKHIFDQ